MALPTRESSLGQPSMACSSSFGQQAGRNLSFTSRSVVGQLDADANPFASMGPSFDHSASFRMPPPDGMPGSELYGTVAGSPYPGGGDPLLDTATGPAPMAAPTVPMSSPPSIMISAPYAVTPTPISMSIAAPCPQGSIMGAAPMAPSPPMGSLNVPVTAPLVPMQAVSASGDIATFSSVPRAVVQVPPTAPTFPSASVSVVPASSTSVAVKSVPVVQSTAGAHYQVGSTVEYRSEEAGSWIKAVVKGIHPDTGHYVLDVDPVAPQHKIRPVIFVPVPTPPGSAPLSPVSPKPVPVPVASSASPREVVYTSMSSIPQEPVSTVVRSIPATGVTTTVTSNPFASQVGLTAAASSSSAPAAGVPAVETIFASAPRVVDAGPPVVTSVSSRVVVGQPRVTTTTNIVTPPVSAGVVTAAAPCTGVMNSAMVAESVTAAEMTQEMSTVMTAAPGPNSYEAQGDPYMVPPGDIWIPVAGQPTVRVEPHWREGQWWFITAVDFKGLEKLPVGSYGDRLVIADDALAAMEDAGEIPPLPVPKAWSETDSCPIT